MKRANKYLKDKKTIKSEDVEVALKIAFEEGRANAFEEASIIGYDYDRIMWERKAKQIIGKIENENK